MSVLDIQELLDPLDLIRRATGLRIQATYNLILRKGWTRFTPQLLLVLQGTIHLYHSSIVKLLRRYCAEHPAGFVLSVIPHFNREIAESQRPVGTATSGSRTILKPKFYEKTTVDRVAERKRLGLEPDCPTGIVLFGGHGSQVMVDITKKLNEAGSGVQLILICGHNQKLAAQLKGLQTRKPIAVVGFAQNVEYYMALADFFIGKPGPGSISEALQFHLPVIVECNSKTLPQERYNAEWVTEKGYGIVVPSFKRIAPAVQCLLQSVTFDEFRQKASEYSNRALFEVPIILEQCAENTTAPTQSHAASL